MMEREFPHPAWLALRKPLTLRPHPSFSLWEAIMMIYYMSAPQRLPRAHFDFTHACLLKHRCMHIQSRPRFWMCHACLCLSSVLLVVLFFNLKTPSQQHSWWVFRWIHLNIYGMKQNRRDSPKMYQGWTKNRLKRASLCFGGEFFFYKRLRRWCKREEPHQFRKSYLWNRAVFS